MMFILPLVLATCALSASLRISERDMVEQQIPGVYQNLALTPGDTSCPKIIRVAQVEPLGNARTQLFAIPHEFISVPNYPSGQLPCRNSRTPAGSVTNISATVLRRSSDLELDRSDPLVNAFALVNEEFFLGYEVGVRVCNGYILPAASVSMWMAPRSGREVLARTDKNIIKFRGGFKYIFYWSDPPCLYQGDARQVGVIREVPSPSPSPSLTARPSPPPVIQAPGSVTVGDTGAGSGDPNANVPVIPPIQRASSSRRVCFPSGAEISVLRGGIITLEQVEHIDAGDVVHDGWDAGTRTFSLVVGVSHWDEDAVTEFVDLRAGNSSLVLSPTHYVVSGRGALPARRIVVGDILFVAPLGRPVPVHVVSPVTRKGLFAPVTRSGTIVVDGVLASVYTETISPPAAHAALAPARAFQGTQPAAACVALAAAAARCIMDYSSW